MATCKLQSGSLVNALASHNETSEFDSLTRHVRQFVVTTSNKWIVSVMFRFLPKEDFDMAQRERSFFHSHWL